MAMNRIQFQLELSMPKFLKVFGNGVKCGQAGEAAR